MSINTYPPQNAVYAPDSDGSLGKISRVGGKLQVDDIELLSLLSLLLAEIRTLNKQMEFITEIKISD